MQQAAPQADRAELVERVSELEEQNEDWLEEVDALNEEIEFIRESWNRALKSNEELARRLQALISSGIAS